MGDPGRWTHRRIPVDSTLCQNATHLVPVSWTSSTSLMFLWQWAYWVSTISQECALDDVLHKSWCCNVNFIGRLLPNFVHPNHYLGSLCSVHKFPPLKSYCSIRSSDWKHISDSHKSMMWLYSCVVMMTGNRLQNDGSQNSAFEACQKQLWCLEQSMIFECIGKGSI